MNIILLRLVEYLGHPNPFIGAVAYTEVRMDPDIVIIYCLTHVTRLGHHLIELSSQGLHNIFLSLRPPCSGLFGGPCQ